MSVSKYQMFLKTVECGSFSRAAEELNFTQSGVSHAVQALEDELGITLLSRNRGGVVLTADGRALLPRVEALCAAHHAPHAVRGGPEGPGRRPGQGGHLLQRLRPVAPLHPQKLRRRLPQHRVRGGGRRFLRPDRGGSSRARWTAASCACPQPNPSAPTPCTGMSCWWSSPAATRWRTRRPSPVGPVRRALHPSGGGPRLRAHRRPGRHGRPPQREIYRPRDRTILAMVSKGLGISLLPELMVRRSPYPVAACHAPERFYRNIGIAVKDEKGPVRLHPPLRGLRPPLGGRKRRGLTSPPSTWERMRCRRAAA